MTSGGFAGLDGCPGGWICARWDGGTGLELWRVAHVAAVFAEGAAPAMPAPTAPAPAILAVDIPIGLPDRVGPGGRAPERLVRPLLGKRQSSVFSVPSRRAVAAGLLEGMPEAMRYGQACETARATSDPPRAVSKQCFHIFPKIAEMDAFLEARPALGGRIFECHPEVSFWAMNGRQPLTLPKTVKGASAPDGLALRLRLLADAGLPVAGIDAARARALGAGLDDLVDACACAWTAARIAAGTALWFPDPPASDGRGRRISISA